MKEQTVIRAARMSAGLSVKDAAEILGISQATYLKKESNPDSLTIAEYSVFREGVGEYGRLILEQYENKNFLAYRQ